MLPDTGCLSEQLRVCLQEGDENPRDFTSLFDMSLFAFTTDTLPQVIRWECWIALWVFTLIMRVFLESSLPTFSFQSLQAAQCQRWASSADHSTVWNSPAAASTCCESSFLNCFELFPKAKHKYNAADISPATSFFSLRNNHFFLNTPNVWTKKWMPCFFRYSHLPWVIFLHPCLNCSIWMKPFPLRKCAWHSSQTDASHLPHYTG